jgi:nucleotide-binding universal stress UspA family protein
MFKRLLLPLDGSARAEQAIPVAACLAHATDGSLIFLSVLPLAGNWIWQEDPLLAREALSVEHEARRVRLEQLTHTPLLAGREMIQEIVRGSPATTILATVQTRQADLIVLCSHGRTGLKRWALGSVAQKIARSSPVPVLILNEQAGTPLSAQISTRPIRVMVALDGSPLAERALQPAIHLSTALSAPFPGALHLVHILPLSLAFEYGQEDRVAKRRRESMQKAQVYLAQMQKQVLANNPTISVTSTLAINQDIAGTLISIAEMGEGEGLNEPAGTSDLIALTTRGRGGFERWVIGSIAVRILSATRLPFLIVHTSSFSQANAFSTQEKS